MQITIRRTHVIIKYRICSRIEAFMKNEKENFGNNIRFIDWLSMAFLLILIGCFKGLDELIDVLNGLIIAFSPLFIIFYCIFATSRKKAIIKSLVVCVVFILWVSFSDLDLIASLKATLMMTVMWIAVLAFFYLLYLIYRYFSNR